MKRNSKKIRFREVIGSAQRKWLPEAEALAQAETPFVIVGFSFAHDGAVFEQIKKRFGLSALLDPQGCRAYFWANGHANRRANGRTNGHTSDHTTGHTNGRKKAA